MNQVLNFQKFISVILIWLVIFLNCWGIFLRPKEANAFAVSVVNFIENQLHQFINFVIKNAMDWIRNAYNWLKKAAIAAIKHHFIKMMTDQIVMWIQGGGKPKFVTDPKGFLWDVVNVTVGTEIWNSDLRWLCYPFHFKLRLVFPSFYQPYYARCTLEDIIGNIQGFFNDFRNGSWLAWDTIHYNPQNSYWGAMLVAHDLYLSELTKEQQARHSEMLAGDSFLGVKRKEYDWASCDDECYETYYEECIEGGGGVDECDEEALDMCCDYKVVTETPGKAVSYALFSAVDAPFKELANEEEIVKAVAIIVDALVSRLIREGVGLLGLGTPAPPGGYHEGNITFPPADSRYRNSAIEEMNQRTFYDRSYAKKIQQWKEKSLEVVEEEILPRLSFIQTNCPFLMMDVNSEIVKYSQKREKLENTVSSLRRKFERYEEIKNEILRANTYDEVDALKREGIALFRGSFEETGGEIIIYTQEKADKAKAEYQELVEERDIIDEIYEECQERVAQSGATSTATTTSP